MIVTATRVRVDPGDVSTWRTMGGILTCSGRWQAAVSLPTFQFSPEELLVQLAKLLLGK